HNKPRQLQHHTAQHSTQDAIIPTTNPTTSQLASGKRHNIALSQVHSPARELGSDTLVARLHSLLLDVTEKTILIFLIYSTWRELLRCTTSYLSHCLQFERG
ncbi:unnamed protein product, partial [Laminaria digitata]